MLPALPARPREAGRSPRRTHLGPALAGALLALATLATGPLAPAVARAQAEPKPAAAPEPPKGPAPIPVAQIGVASVRAKSMLKEFSEAIEPQPEVEAVAAQLPELRALVDERLDLSERARAEENSLPALDQLKAGWRELGERIAAAQRLLRSRSEQMEKRIASIATERAAWDATREVAVSRELSAEVVAQIAEVQKAADQAIARAKQRQGEILALQSEVARLAEQVAGDQRGIDALRETLVGQFLTRDQPAFWHAEFWRFIDYESVSKRLRDHLSSERSQAALFITKRREGAILFTLAALAFTVVMILARPAILRRLEQDERPGVGAIFERPISLSLLVVFFIAILSLDQAPATVIPLLGALTLLPAVLILRALIDPQLFPMMNAVVVIFLVDRLRMLVLTLPHLPRLVFVIEMLTFILLTAVWLRPERLRDVPRESVTNRVARLAAHGMRAAFVLASAALGTQLAGYTSLSYMLGSTLIVSSYAAIVLYGTVRVADGLLAVLLRVRPLRLLGMVRRNRPLLRHRAFLVIQAAAWFLWVRTALRRAEIWDDLALGLRQLLGAELPLAEVTITLGDIVACIITFYAAILTSRFIRFALQEDVYTRVHLPKGRPYAISTLLHYTMVLIGLGLAGAALGLDPNRFTLLAGAFGVGIGFGLQTIVNNFVSGIILLTERPIEVGDTLEIGTVFGKVERIGIRSSTVRTWQGAEVLVPNADLVAQQVTNWTHSDQRRRLEIPVGVAYGSDPQQVIEILTGVARAEERVLDHPEPTTLFLGFGESSLDFEVRAWTDRFDEFMQVRSAICVGITAALTEAGITIPFPQRDLHLKTLPGDTQPAQASAPPAPREGAS